MTTKSFKQLQEYLGNVVAMSPSVRTLGDDDDLPYYDEIDGTCEVYVHIFGNPKDQKKFKDYFDSGAEAHITVKNSQSTYKRLAMVSKTEPEVFVISAEDWHAIDWDSDDEDISVNQSAPRTIVYGASTTEASLKHETHNVNWIEAKNKITKLFDNDTKFVFGMAKRSGDKSAIKVSNFIDRAVEKAIIDELI